MGWYSSTAGPVTEKMIKNIAKFFCMLPLVLGIAGASIVTNSDASNPPNDELREQAEKQFDTQFMAAQLLHDRSRGKFDQGGLADMSENTLEGFDMAKSKWKWKYDEQIRGLMGKGFSLKEAIDEMWNKYQMMPYKGFSMEVT